MSESDRRPRKRQASLPYLPPPPSSKEELPDVRVPRAQPPPPSLSALLSGGAGEGSRAAGLGSNARTVLALVLLGVLAAVAYVALTSGS